MAPSTLPPNPVLKSMGFGPKDRVVVFHADDIGMCQATLPAYEDALEYGVLSAAAVMVPCPWFPALARVAREQAKNPRLDLGVHLTLTSEWQEYRWGPISTREHSSGLLDDDGFFPSLAAPVVANAQLDALEAELRAQVERALAAGIDVTHLDSHMLTVLHRRLLPVYMKVALDYQLPAFMVRDASRWQDSTDGTQESLVATEKLLEDVQEQGMALFDEVVFLSLSESKDRVDYAKKVLKNLPAGLSNFIVHPAVKSSELRALAPDWKSRVADAELFVSKEWRKIVADSGVTVIGFRPLRDALRGSLGKKGANGADPAA